MRLENAEARSVSTPLVSLSECGYGHGTAIYLVTGGNRGIVGVRQAACREGHRAIGTARAADRESSPELHRAAAAVVQLDVPDPGSIRDLHERLDGSPIDIVINNAGVSSDQKTLDSLEATELQRVFMINSFAPMLVVRSILPDLRAGDRKLVVSITSQLGSISNNTGGSTYAYRASKAALNQLTRSLAAEFKPEGFTCVAVHPGWVRTDMGGPRAPLTPGESVRSMIALFERLSPDDTGRFLNYDGAALPW